MNVVAPVQSVNQENAGSVEQLAPQVHLALKEVAAHLVLEDHQAPKVHQGKSVLLVILVHLVLWEKRAQKGMPDQAV